MQALDSMRYAPEKLTVKSGQTVRFIVTNAGKLKHEFAIGDAEEQRQHAEMMKERLDMKHDERCCGNRSSRPAMREAIGTQFSRSRHRSHSVKYQQTTLYLPT